MAVDRDMPALVSVEAGEGWTLQLRFAGDDRARRADLTGLLARSRPFAALRANPERFRDVAIVMRGSGVEWPVEHEGDRLDLSASTLLQIAEEQEPMSGRDFAAWRTGLGMSHAVAAATLGLSRRTVIDYEKRELLPTVIAIACRTLTKDRTALAAHYHPPKPAGRPRKVA